MPFNLFLILHFFYLERPLSLSLFFFKFDLLAFPHFVTFFQAIQTTNIAKEWVDHTHAQLKDEEAHQVSAVKILVMVEKKIKDLGSKLTEANRERKSAEAALAGAKK